MRPCGRSVTASSHGINVTALGSSSADGRGAEPRREIDPATFQHRWSIDSDGVNVPELQIVSR